MKVNLQIKADKYLGLPLGILLNGIVRVLGKILRINHTLDREFQRIAIVKYKGLGSIVQATPLLNALKQQYPNSKITFITSAQNKELVTLLRDVDDVLLFNDSSTLNAVFSLPGFIIQLIKRRFQLLFDLELYSNISSILSTLSSATNRFGFYRSASHYRMGLYTHMMFFNTRSPLSETYLQLARAIGCDTKTTTLTAFNIQSGEKLKKPYMLINVNASDLRIERRWPGEHFAGLSDRLASIYPDHHQYFLGSSSEATYVDSVLNLKKEKSENVTSLAGKTSLTDLIGIISSAAFMITCDTGPAHLAYTQGLPTAVLFGPVSPEQFHIPENSIAIYKRVYCSPCVHEFDVPPCGGDNQCMKLISVDEVLEVVAKLKSGENSGSGSGTLFQYRGEDHKPLGKVVRSRP